MRESFWSVTFPRNASTIAKSIWATRELIRNESCFIIGSGNHVDLWNSHWVPWMEFDQCKATFNLLTRAPGTKVSVIFYSSMFVSWDQSSLETFFWPDFVSTIQNIKIFPRSQDDRLF